MMSRALLPLTTCCAALLLTACAEFTAGVEEPDLAAEAARIQSQVRPGQTTRQEVRALLGAPIFEDPSWGIELYPLGRSRELPEISYPEPDVATAAPSVQREGKLEAARFLESLPVYRYRPTPDRRHRRSP